MVHNDIRIALAAYASVACLVAQHRVWRIDAPSVGPFGDEIAIIGDRDGDGWHDIVRAVYIPIYPGSAWLFPHAWSFSGRTGQLLASPTSIVGGPLTSATAGDANGDGIGDYLTGALGAWLPACAPAQCSGVEVRSGRDDSVLWHADLPPLNSLGQMAIGDLDLDGDGFPDALIGTNQASPAFGSLFAISSRGHILWTLTAQPGAPFGAGIGKFIDYDHDGCDDFLLGAIVSPNGAVDIRSGRDGSLLQRLLGPPAIWGYGHTAAMAGDMDGDGIADVIAGDSGPFTPGAIAVLGSVSGAMIHRWQVNSIGRDDFGFPAVVSIDVDRDGIDDVIANSRSSTGNVGQYTYSGRDGSLIERYTEVDSYLVENLVALPPQSGDAFPRWAATGVYGTTTRAYMFSGGPDGVERTGAGSAGTLPRMPILGLRELIPSGFRVTLASAESSAFAWLVIGFNQPPLPYADLSLLGFTNSFLYPQPDLVSFFVTGSTWPDAGYVAHDFPLTLVPAGTPGAFTAYLQWIVFGNGPTWPGGVSEAMRIHVQ